MAKKEKSLCVLYNIGDRLEYIMEKSFVTKRDYTILPGNSHSPSYYKKIEHLSRSPINICYSTDADENGPWEIDTLALNLFISICGDFVRHHVPI